MHTHGALWHFVHFIQTQRLLQEKVQKGTYHVCCRYKKGLVHCCAGSASAGETARKGAAHSHTSTRQRGASSSGLSPTVLSPECPAATRKRTTRAMHSLQEHTKSGSDKQPQLKGACQTTVQDLAIHTLQQDSAGASNQAEKRSVHNNALHTNSAAAPQQACTPRNPSKQAASATAASSV